jgi:hypothetical protein
MTTMIRLQVCAAFALVVLLGACAEMRSLTSPSAPPAKQPAPPPASGKPTGTEADAATLDAKQQLLLGNAVGVICAEPRLYGQAPPQPGSRDAAFVMAPTAQWSALIIRNY